MSRFKTELCNNLIELGSCKYGDRCHYAHGAHELRQVSRRHPKYRTEKCKNFESTGKCPFGPRCSYVHPKPDLDEMLEQLRKYWNNTKAPKPDSEDDDEDTGLFTRTNTSTSIPTCGSILSNSDHDYENSNHDSELESDENKENQLIAQRRDQISANLKNPSSVQRPLALNNSIINHSQLPAITSRTKIDKSSLATAFRPIHNIDLSNNDATTVIDSSNYVSSQAINISSSTRTPLGSNNGRNNFLTLINTTSTNSQVAAAAPESTSAKSDFQNQLKATYSPTLNATSSTYQSTRSKNFSLFEAPPYESNKKLRLSSDNPGTSSSSSGASSHPFGINNPLSDLLNNRSPLQPNKQFYTRF